MVPALARRARIGPAPIAPPPNRSYFAASQIASAAIPEEVLEELKLQKCSCGLVPASVAAQSLVRLAAIPGMWQSPRVKIDAPEVRRRRQKLHSHPLATLPALSQEHNPTFLLFLGQGVEQHEHLAAVHLVPQRQQASMGIHHQGFADFAELPPIVAAALGLQLHLVEDALAAPRRCIERFIHALIMGSNPQIRQLPFGTGVSQVPIRFLGTGLYPVAAGLKISLAAPASCPAPRLHPAAALFLEIFESSYRQANFCARGIYEPY